MAFENAELLAQIKPLERFAYKLCKNADDAKDLLQDTLLRTLDKRDKFEEGGNMFGWSSKIMYNLFVSGYRRQAKFESRYELTDAMIDQDPVDASQNYIVDLGHVNDAMQSMPDYFRTVLITVAAMGMTYEEAEEKLHVPAGTLRSRLNRARAMLDKKLNQAPAAHVISRAPCQSGFRTAVWQTGGAR